MSINRVTISGNLTRDPEIRSTQGGMDILSFGMAVNDRRRNPQSGEWEDYANFVDCVLFGNRAEFFGRHLHKGKKAYVEGKLRYRSWEKDGEKRSKIEVVVDEIDLEFPPRQQGRQPQQGYAQPAPQAYQQAPQGYQQQAPQGYGRPASAPQPQQAANYAQPAQYAPQQPPRQPSAPSPQPAPQQAQIPMQQGQEQFPAPQGVYDEDIPF